MSRYIDADALREKMYHDAFEEDSEEQKWDGGCWIRYKMFERNIESTPTAEVAEVKHGRWVVDREFGNDVMSGEQMVICSECGKGIFWGRQNYCPNCGARMEADNGLV